MSLSFILLIHLIMNSARAQLEELDYEFVLLNDRTNDE